MEADLNQELISFRQTLNRHNLDLTRKKTTTLQVNVGLLCNHTCRHCHLEAGPQRKEIMDSETVAQVIEFAGRFQFEVIDITGGAPEMNPHIKDLILGLAPLAPRLLLRSNLTAMTWGRCWPISGTQMRSERERGILISSHAGRVRRRIFPGRDSAARFIFE